MQEPTTTTAMSSDEVSRTIRRMSAELLEVTAGTDDVILLGIITRGVPLARRVAAHLAENEGADVPVGELDVTMYRDDLRRQPARPAARTVVPADIDDKIVVLVDDVLFSGRTVQAALHALADLGRPRGIKLMALVDRSHRELPIQADIVGRQLFTAVDERVRVQVSELDGEDAVTITAAADSVA